MKTRLHIRPKVRYRSRNFESRNWFVYHDGTVHIECEPDDSFYGKHTYLQNREVYLVIRPEDITPMFMLLRDAARQMRSKGMAQ